MVRLTPARPEQTGETVPDARHLGAALLPVGQGLRGPQGGAPLPLQETRTEGRPWGKQSCSSLGPTGADLTPQELIPCGRTGLRKLALPPLCAHSFKHRGCSQHPHSPEIYQDPQPPGSRPGSSQMKLKFSKPRRGLRTLTLPGRHPLSPLPHRSVDFLPRSHRGHSWRDRPFEDPKAGPLPHGSG